ncbi:MAG: FkbM family methyltransferase [Candidatus Erginobacter occultus]|nr:FkbM family methyltransferase [Candidatus Erginobacter occultus]
MKTSKEKFLLPLIDLVPWPVRNLFYRLPGVGRVLRWFLNRALPAEDRLSPVRITAGPLKGLWLEIDFQKEKFFWLGTHEPAVQKALRDLVKPGMTVYDVGTYIGFFTLLLSRAVGDTGRVIALEPNPETHRRLLRNLRLNRRENVQTLMLAAADKSGREIFQTAKNNLAPEAHLVTSATVPEPDPAPKVEVETVALDDLVFDRGFPRPDLLKIDVEESEARVLAGMDRILKECRPVIVCETHGLDASREVARALRRHRYSLLDLERDKPIPAETVPRPGRLYLLATPNPASRP